MADVTGGDSAAAGGAGRRTGYVTGKRRFAQLSLGILVVVAAWAASVTAVASSESPTSAPIHRTLHGSARLAVAAQPRPARGLFVRVGVVRPARTRHRKAGLPASTVRTSTAPAPKAPPIATAPSVPVPAIAPVVTNAPPTTSPAPPITAAATASPSTAAPPPPAASPPASSPAATASGFGCAAALQYLATHAAPGFTFECPGDALGHQAMTCIDVAGVCPGEHVIAIADPCRAAYMNEASNSYRLEGQSDAPLDPYGSC